MSYTCSKCGIEFRASNPAVSANGHKGSLKENICLTCATRAELYTSSLVEIKDGLDGCAQVINRTMARLDKTIKALIEELYAERAENARLKLQLKGAIAKWWETPQRISTIFEGINSLVGRAHGNAVTKGFHEGEQNIPEILMLIVSEVSEALEAHRRSKVCNWRVVNLSMDYLDRKVFEEQVKDSFQDELADVVIRVFDLCGSLDINLGWHIREKMYYNEGRECKHGKQY